MARAKDGIWRNSILMMAFIQQVAWQMSYGMTMNYFRSHPKTAQAVGFANRYVISVGRYWERHRVLGIWPFLVFLPWNGLIDIDVILDSITQCARHHKDGVLPEFSKALERPSLSL